MLRHALIAAMAACALAVPATAAAENPHQPVESTWAYAPTALDISPVIGQQIFIHGMTSDEFHGTFEGTGVTEFSITHHAIALFNVYEGVTEFVGAVVVDGQEYEGTLTIRSVGRQDPGYAYPSELPFEGTWVIQHATGELAGLQGHGSFTGPSFFITLAGTIHHTG
jgi:hypothetical protein